MISKHHHINSIRTYLSPGFLFLALFFAGLNITIDLAQAAPIVGARPSLPYGGQSLSFEELRSLMTWSQSVEEIKRLNPSLSVEEIKRLQRPKLVALYNYYKGQEGIGEVMSSRLLEEHPELELDLLVNQQLGSIEFLRDHYEKQAPQLKEIRQLERLPDGRFLLYDLKDTKSRPSAKLIYKQTRAGVPDESVSLFNRDIHGKFTAVEIPSDPQYLNTLERHATAITDLIATALYKKRLHDRSYPPKGDETPTLEETTEAINELTKTQDYQTKPSVGSTADKGSAKVADIQSTTLQKEKLEIELKPKFGEENQFKGVVNLKEVCQKIKLSGWVNSDNTVEDPASPINAPLVAIGGMILLASILALLPSSSEGDTRAPPEIRPTDTARKSNLSEVDTRASSEIHPTNTVRKSGQNAHDLVKPEK